MNSSQVESQLTEPLSQLLCTPLQSETSGANQNHQQTIWGRLIGNMGSLDLRDRNKQYLLGRHKTCDLRANQDLLQVSNRHCVIQLKQCSADGQMLPFLRDISMNGTFINGRKVGMNCEIPLKHNDHIELIAPSGSSSSSSSVSGAFLVFRDPVREYQLQQQDSEFASFADYFILDTVIGRGAFGVVKCGIDRTSGQRVACKIIFKDRIKGQQPGKDKLLFHHIKHEIDILRKIHHPNLIRTWDIFERESCIAIVMELVENGDLFSYIERRGTIPEQEARFLTFQMLLGLEYLHSRNMCHRDLKPENILIGSEHAYPRLVIADFGLAKAGLDETMLKTFCGTMGYLAPEVISPGEGYTVAVDCWSLGVIVYTMLAGYFPFPDESEVVLAKAVKAGQYDFRSQEWLSISCEAMSFISSLIVVDPNQRMTVADAYRHPWIAEFVGDLEIMYNVYIMDHYNKNSLDRVASGNGNTNGEEEADVTVAVE